MNLPALNSVGVIGAGAWGTALAQVFAEKGLQVALWAHEPDVVESINARHSNDLYLPGITLHPNIKASHTHKDVFSRDILVIVAPTQHVGKIVEAGAQFVKKDVPVLIAAKGIEIKTGRLLSHIVSAILPDHPVGVLTGPSFAIEVARNLPAALTIALPTRYNDLAYRLCEILSTLHFRLYASDDIIGAQIGGAIKNVIAIACGIAHGKNMGDNARAAILTRGMAEMVRLGVAMGADPETFLGLSGIGDLTLTCNAMQSRNFSLGAAIGQGRRAADILSERASVAEGYYTAEAAVKLAESLNIDMPICHAVYETLHKEKAIDYVIKGLLERPVKSE
jgi:glycerol-3-phosphate dehydrogenase (NAD(P)+)